MRGFAYVFSAYVGTRDPGGVRFTVRRGLYGRSGVSIINVNKAAKILLGRYSTFRRSGAGGRFHRGCKVPAGTFLFKCINEMGTSGKVNRLLRTFRGMRTGCSSA